MRNNYIAEAAAALMLLAAGQAAAQSGSPALPAFKIVLTPHAKAGPESYLGVRGTLGAPNLKAGDELVRLPLRIVGIPGATLLGPGLTAKDAAGPLTLTIEELPPTPQGQYQAWRVSRPTSGDVEFTYKAAPRVVTEATNNGPLFDLREEGGGFIGAGVTFLAAPGGGKPYRLSLDWDLGKDAGALRGVSSLGEGHVETVGPGERVTFSFYAVGPVKSTSKGSFGFYWLNPPPFDAGALGDKVEKLYGGMSRFFGDEPKPYRVFVRQNPFAGTGGTALPQSFMFGYRAADKPAIETLQGLISHEMAHNWPSLEGEHGDTAWYSEGTAEYYSMLLSYRSGLITLEALTKSLNDKAAAYFSNPYLRLTNPEAAKIFWSDPIAQTVPYGRGLFYLLGTDAAIRESSQGKHSVDDVVVALYKRKQAQQPYDLSVWLDLVGKEIGADRAKADYAAMTGGQILSPGDRFKGCLLTKPKAYRVFDLGFDRGSLNDARIVKGLKPDAAAYTAGLREGDHIVSERGLLEARKSDGEAIHLVVERGGAKHDIAFVPRGQSVAGIEWVKSPEANDQACKL